MPDGKAPDARVAARIEAVEQGAGVLHFGLAPPRDYKLRTSGRSGPS